MSRFRFALQPLLDARTWAESERRAEFAAAAREASSDRTRVRLARDAFTEAARGFSACAVSLAPAAVREALARLELLEAAMHAAEALGRRATACEERARDAYAAARLERRRIGALHERALAAFEAVTDRRETLALEEANAATHNAITFLASSFHN